jgi:hypothetical protein
MRQSAVPQEFRSRLARAICAVPPALLRVRLRASERAYMHACISACIRSIHPPNPFAHRCTHPAVHLGLTPGVSIHASIDLETCSPQFLQSMLPWPRLHPTRFAMCTCCAMWLQLRRQRLSLWRPVKSKLPRPLIFSLCRAIAWASNVGVCKSSSHMLSTQCLCVQGTIF